MSTARRRRCEWLGNPRLAASRNIPGAATARGMACQPFSSEEHDRIERELAVRPPHSIVQYKPGAGHSGAGHAYLPGYSVFELANKVFGFNGWSGSVVKTEVDFCEADPTKPNRYHMGVVSVVRVTLKDGTYKEDAGYGSVQNFSGRGDAKEKCIKESITDAYKRAFRQFGNAFGLCLYDKKFLSALKRGQGDIYVGPFDTPKTMILTHWLNEGNCLGRVIIRAALGTGRRYKVLITMQVRFRHQPAVANHLKHLNNNNAHSSNINRRNINGSNSNSSNTTSNSIHNNHNSGNNNNHSINPNINNNNSS
ncbi:unnamed protein product (mitochondrion) [Plasmodiophora brassicae]|uniref:Uncharacterized protein n=1 Tax=Plasmodiophora brassicae TaxID=37360 RepID=A0A3P3YIV5_PLABS|nr:unnamed protein product [Plasmodiophora brassicae]